MSAPGNPQPETDTFARSCAHWSEAGRRGMEDFYALASVDYRHLAEARDWKAWFEQQQSRVGSRHLRLLDVACGSGKFPAALLRHSAVPDAAIQPVDYALLDPARFSIDEARAALAPPFVPGAEYEATLQDLRCPDRHYDIVWATHALYAVPATEIDAAMTRFLAAMGGTGFIAHAREDAHYLHFYRLFLDAFYGGEGTPYTSAEQLIETLDALGADFSVTDIDYHNGVPLGRDSVIEGYLQRCAFDDSIGLDAMLAHPELGAYLRGCQHDGAWRFRQKVALISIEAAPMALAP